MAMVTEKERRLAAIARLDAELASAVAAPSTPLLRKPVWVVSGALAGWMFAGAVAGSVGAPFCAALGAIAGGYRAFTGDSVLAYLSKTASPVPAKFAGGNTTTMPFPLAQLPPPTANCGSKGAGKPSC